MNSFSDVIDALGVATVSEVLGIPESHVRTLKARDSIPAGYFKRLVDAEAGQRAGVTFELLYRLRDEIAERRAPKVVPQPERAA
ncbi:hypothetical protein [Methylobacterium brachiatum]|uniref:hypothetical protein n=1 Tax=Methylobacterium brachiatum TaxID=269660 RepID=UPI000EFAC076|nr:hypothetical protein [Methylobacterium brachiatum]AYO85362.1 hypothetical protein EBB05_26155 [Methylobacterium brachiatum]